MTKARAGGDRRLEYEALRQLLRLITESDEPGAAARLRTAIETELTGRQREYIMQYYIEQKFMSQIAADCGVELSTVSRTIKRGRARLERCLRYGGRGLLERLEEVC